jgi:DNA modification methylase
MVAELMTIHFEDAHLTVHVGDVRDCLRELPAESVHTVVTSPPYWGLRDYGTATWEGGERLQCPECDGAGETTESAARDEACPRCSGFGTIACDHRDHAARRPDERRASTLGGGVATIAAQDAGARARATCERCGARRIDAQIGLEPTPEEYVATMVDVFREVRRVLRADGTVWLNLGDSYAGGGTIGRNDTGPEDIARRAAAYGTGTGSGSAIGPQGTRAHVSGLKHKDLVGIPWRVAFALQADGWYLRSDIIWAKPNPMPESVTDRPTKAHEYVFLLSKSARYWYDADAVREPLSSGPSDLRKIAEGKDRIGGLVKDLDDPLLRASGRTNIGRKRSVGSKQAAMTALDHRRAGTNAAADRAESGEQGGRNLRTVWTIATEPYPGAHFATFPRKLVEPCVKAGCPADGTVLDPFAGSGTTGVVANALGRRAVLIDLNADYIDQAMKRNAQAPLGIAG